MAGGDGGQNPLRRHGLFAATPWAWRLRPAPGCNPNDPSRAGRPSMGAPAAKLTPYGKALDRRRDREFHWANGFRG